MNKRPRSIRRGLKRGSLRLVSIIGTMGGMMLQRRTNNGGWENLFSF